METNEDIRKRQDKRWSELTEEQRKSAFRMYQMICEYYSDQNMKKWYEETYGKHNVGMEE